MNFLRRLVQAAHGRRRPVQPAAPSQFVPTAEPVFFNSEAAYPISAPDPTPDHPAARRSVDGAVSASPEDLEAKTELGLIPHRKPIGRRPEQAPPSPAQAAFVAIDEAADLSQDIPRDPALPTTLASELALPAKPLLVEPPSTASTEVPARKPLAVPLPTADSAAPPRVAGSPRRPAREKLVAQTTAATSTATPIPGTDSALPNSSSHAGQSAFPTVPSTRVDPEFDLPILSLPRTAPPLAATRVRGHPQPPPAAAPSSQSPDIHITIGTVEVRAAVTVPPPPRNLRPPANTKLSDYLRRRAGKGEA